MYLKSQYSVQVIVNLQVTYLEIIQIKSLEGTCYSKKNQKQKKKTQTKAKKTQL